MNLQTAKHIKLSAKDKRFTIINYILLALFLLIELYPLWIVLVSSFSHPDEVASGHVWLWPVKPSLLGYKAVFQYKLILSGFMNSTFLMVFGTFTSLVVTVLAAYPLARKDLPGKKVIMFLFTFTMFFGGGLIPFFMVVRDLNLMNSLWGLIIPGALNVWNIIVMKTYFQTNIPDELHDAAKMDGCSDFRFLVSIVLPLSKPILAVMALFFAVGFWNSYFNALLFIDVSEKFPLQLVLRDILVINQTDATQIGQNIEGLKNRHALIEALKYSVIVVSTAPLLILYPFVQKHFVKGLLVGSIKG